MAEEFRMHIGDLVYKSDGKPLPMDELRLEIRDGQVYVLAPSGASPFWGKHLPKDVTLRFETTLTYANYIGDCYDRQGKPLTQHAHGVISVVEADANGPDKFISFHDGRISNKGWTRLEGDELRQALNRHVTVGLGPRPVPHL
jgi:hypothetical protein